jgi:hypothetical protein
MALRAALSNVDRVPEHVLLWVNVALACFVALAHGGALALTYAKPTPDAESIRQLALISLPLATLVILTAVAALFRGDYRKPTLGLHGWILVASAVAALVWASSLLYHGIPKGNFAWTPGLMSVWACYSVFVASRFGVPSSLRGRLGVFYSPLVALAIALPIDVGVFVQFIGEIGKRFG